MSDPSARNKLHVIIQCLFTDLLWLLCFGGYQKRKLNYKFLLNTGIFRTPGY